MPDFKRRRLESQPLYFCLDCDLRKPLVQSSSFHRCPSVFIGGKNSFSFLLLNGLAFAANPKGSASESKKERSLATDEHRWTPIKTGWVFGELTHAA
ncbi:MAG: hypothetical protein Q8O00_02485 [Holophaga sp.]|nr:hypothetical protein [Holophaga sp.]